MRWWALTPALKQSGQGHSYEGVAVLFTLARVAFALLLAYSRIWYQLLALVSPNCVFEAVWATPLVRLAVLERSSDHLGLFKARCFIVVGYVAEASREKIAAHVAGLAQIVGSMCPKLQGLRGEQHGNHSGRWFRELSDLIGVLLDQVHANHFLHHTTQESTCIKPRIKPRNSRGLFLASVIYSNVGAVRYRGRGAVLGARNRTNSLAKGLFPKKGGFPIPTAVRPSVAASLEPKNPGFKSRRPGSSWHVAPGSPCTARTP